MKKLSLVLVIVVLFVGMTSCGQVGSALDFSGGNGMTITLTNEFSYASSGEYNACFLSSNTAVYVLRESEEKLGETFENPEELSLTDYANAVLANNGMTCEVSEEDGLVSFTYEEFVGDVAQGYLVCVYHSDDAFWVVQFICAKSLFESLMPSYIGWAKTVRFAQT